MRLGKVNQIKKVIKTLLSDDSAKKGSKKTGSKDTVKDLIYLQKEAYDEARAQGLGVLKSLKEADKVKEEFELAKTGIRSRYGGIVKAMGGTKEVEDVVNRLFGKKISKEEQLALKKKYGLVEEKKKPTDKSKKEAAAAKKLANKTFDLVAQVYSMLNTIRLTVAGIANKLKASAAKEVSIRDGKYFDEQGKRLKKKDIEKGSGLKYSKETSRYRDVKSGRFVSTANAMQRMNLTKPLASPRFSSKVLKAKGKDIVAEKLNELSTSVAGTPGLVDKVVDDEKIDEKLDDILSEIGFVASPIPISIHGKLNTMMVMLRAIAARVAASSVIDAVDSVDGPDKKNKPSKTKPSGRLGGLKGALGKVARGAGRIMSTPVQTVALVVGGTAYMASGKAGDEAKSTMDTLESKYGLKTVYDDKGRTVGYSVKGKKYGLDDLPQEYKDLIEAYGPGDKRSASARAALKRIKENEAKYKALEVSAQQSQPVVAPKSATQPPAAPTTTPAAAPVAVSPPPAAPTPAPTAPVGESTRAATSMPGAIPRSIGGQIPKLDQVVDKKGGVDTSGLVSGFKDRMALMAAKFEEVTGKRLLITSAYRSDEQQLELWNKKVAELKSQHPDWSADQLMKAARKWVALPMALGGKGSAHIRGVGTDFNSKGPSGIDAIDGQVVDGQKITTDQFLAKFGLVRPMAHEPWHIQPVDVAPLPDNPDPNSKPLVADAKGNAINLESGKADSSAISPKAEALVSDASKSQPLPPVTPAAPEQPSMAAKSPPSSPVSSAQVATPNLAPTATPPPAVPSVAAAMPVPPRATPIEPTPVTGTQIAAETTAVTESKEMMAANLSAPVVIPAPAKSSPQPQQRPQAADNSRKASVRHGDSAFVRALAKDFAHPSAFTTIGTV